MKQVLFIFSVCLLISCGDDTATNGATSVDSVSTEGMTPEQIDSLHRMQEEEEMGAHILEGVLMR